MPLYDVYSKRAVGVPHVNVPGAVMLTLHATLPACLCRLCCSAAAPWSALLRQTFLPLDLRVKKTRAIRRRLSKEQVRLGCCCLLHYFVIHMSWYMFGHGI
jgi:hypothetical protein